MYPCTRCGDLKVHAAHLSCSYCLHGPMIRYESGSSIGYGRHKAPKCSNCGRDVEVEYTGTEWGSRQDYMVSSITDEPICGSCPIPRKCLKCYQIFPSGRLLHAHLRENPDHQWCSGSEKCSPTGVN